MDALDEPYQFKGSFDLVVLVTAHKDCLSLDWGRLKESMRQPLIYDGRRVLDLDQLSSLGWQTYAVGKPR